MSFPGWWQEGVRVVGTDDVTGALRFVSRTWCVQPDGDDSPGSLVFVADPSDWSVVVDHTVTPTQLRAVAYDAERALLRTFGCHYVPEWLAVPESTRTDTDIRPSAVGRPELAGLQAVVRGAILDALRRYVR
jgi:hypothetical protein